ncbi:MAG TPA: fibronectin type III domain-containing protein, partial [Cellulomonas sp.]
TLEIPLDEQIQVAPGRTATVADATAVTATRSDGSSLVLDSTTVRYTSAAGYVGPASITIPVTDATGPGDTSARTSVITLSITVYTEDDYPPVFVPSVLSVAPGEVPVSVDLLAFTEGVEGATGSTQDYRFALTSGTPAGFTATLDGTRLSVSTDAATPKGTRATLQLTLGYGRSGSMDVQVEVRTIASTRKVAAVPSRSIGDGVQGKETVVDILDGAYNPFPDEPLRIVGVVVETPGAGTASVAGSAVSVRPAADLVGQMVVRVRVRDATDDSSREVAATITVQVRGRPATPKVPRIGEVRDSTVVLSWDAPDSRGEPITGYQVTASPGGRQTACASTTCTITELTNDVEYTFTVAAKNAVDWSDPSPASAVARPDAVPETPGAPRWTGFGDGTLDVSWDAPVSKGSPITSYTLMISPAPSGGSASATTSGTSYTFRGLTNGTAYTVQVRAANRAPQPSGWSPSSAPETPARAPEAPRVSAGRVGTPLGGQISLTWTAPATNGDPVSGYRLRITGGGINRTETFDASVTTYAMTDAANGVQYHFEVQAQNKAGYGTPGTADAKAYGRPTTPGSAAVSASPSSAEWGQGWAKIDWAEADGNGQTIQGYEILRDGAVIATVGRWDRSYQIPDLTGGQTFTLQVRAVHDGGTSDPAGASVTIATRPRPISQPTVTRTPDDPTVRPSTVHVAWDASQSGDGSAVSYAYVLKNWPGADQTQRETTTNGIDLTLPADYAGNSVEATIEVWATTAAGASTQHQTQRIQLSWVLADPGRP